MDLRVFGRVIAADARDRVPPTPVEFDPIRKAAVPRSRFRRNAQTLSPSIQSASASEVAAVKPPGTVLLDDT